jgi:hypothetical protein
MMLAGLLGVGADASAATAPTITFPSVRVSGYDATIKYKINRRPKAVATRTCKLDSAGTPCGKRVASTDRSTTYKVTLRELATGAHALRVEIALTTGKTARATVQFAISDPCQVTNSTTQKYYGGTGANLQTAINEVTGIDSLQIQGVCTGNFSAPSNLNLVGMGSPQATLDGNGTGVTLTIDSIGTVLLTDLTITGGVGTFTGGGIKNDNGDLILNGSTSVTGNSAPGGAGIYDGSNASLVMNDSSSVSFNTASSNGGGVLADISPVTMNGTSSISHNTSQSNGGGVYIFAATLTMASTSSISSNGAQTAGGGVYADGATLVGAVSGENVTANTPENIFTAPQ